MKKKKVTGLLIATALSVALLTGCSSSNKEEQNQTQETQNSESKANEEEIAEAAKIEIEELEKITDWTTMAKISLDDGVTITGEGAIVSDGVITISKGGEYIFTGTLADGMIYVDTEDDVKITLNGVSITNNDGPAIYGAASSSIYVNTQKDTQNVLTDGSDYQTDEDGKSIGKGTIFSKDRLIFTGEGSLQVTGNYKHAICSKEMIYVENGTIDIVSAVKDGFHANDGICIDDGTITVETANDALESEGAFEVNGGKITTTSDDKGLETLGNLTINDGTIEIISCEEGLEGKNAIIINGGKIEITANDDGVNAGNELQVNGGKIFADVSSGDGLDSNGTLSISGGLIVALGAQAPEDGIDCDEREITITGGTIIACGGANSAPSETDSTIVSIWLGSASKGDTIGILDADGNTVFAFEVSKDYSNMLLSMKAFSDGEEYTVYTGGTISGESSYHGYYKKGTYSGGSESVSFTVDSKVISAGGTSSQMGGGPGGEKGNGAPRGNGEPPTDENGNMQKPDENSTNTTTDDDSL